MQANDNKDDGDSGLEYPVTTGDFEVEKQPLTKISSKKKMENQLI